MFKKLVKLFLNRKSIAESQHTCGSWPDSYWTKEDWKKKNEAQVNCVECNK